MQIDWTELFARNISDYEGYSIGKLFVLLKDPEIISLAGGLPSPDMFQKAELREASQKALADNIDSIMQYAPVPGEPELIEAIIAFLKHENIEASPENLLVTTSGQQGLDVIGRQFLDPGDVVVLDRPTFAGALSAFNMQRPVYAGVDMHEDGSDVEAMEAQIKRFSQKGRKPKFIYVVPDFQNPTGITMSLEKRLALLEVSRKHGVPIIEDSPYRGLRYVGENHPTLYSLDQQQGGGNVIWVFTFSKLFCPGMRVGFNMGPAEIMDKMTSIKEGSTLNTPKYNQDMCAAFLDEMDWPAHLEKSRAFYKQKLDACLAAMEKHFPQDSGVRWTKPRGGLFLWITLPERIDTMDLFYEAVEHKVAFVPGHSFFGQDPAVNHMRINFSYPAQDQLLEALRRLAECIHQALAKG